MIPKLIHQTAKDAAIPARWRRYQDRVRALHPGWSYRLWTDADNLAFVEQHFPELRALFEALPRGIMRADVIRYLLMHQLGGLYLDLDYEVLRPFDLCWHRVVLPKNRSRRAGDREDSLGNAVFASEPRHPFWRAVIDALLQAPPLAPDLDPVEATGPGLLTRVWRRFDAQGTGVYAPERELFHPRSSRARWRQRQIRQGGVARGIHHCHGTWR